MAAYRIYHLQDRGRLALGESFEATSDEAAVARAQQLHRSGEACELWAGGRLVGRFSRLGSFSRGQR